MRVIQIQNEAELRALKPAWDGLLRESAADTIFLTWEWVTAWWGAYGKPGELWILAAFDEQDVLRGIAPLRRETVRQRFAADDPVEQRSNPRSDQSRP